MAHKTGVGGAGVPVIALAVGGTAILGWYVHTLAVQAGVVGAGIRVYALRIVGAAVGIDHGNTLPTKTGVGGTNISVVAVAVSFAAAGDGFVLARTIGQAFVRRASILIITGRVILTAAAAGDGRKHTARIRVAGIGRAQIIVAALEVRRHTLATGCARIYRACIPVITRVVVLASAAIGDGLIHAARARVAGIGRAGVIVAAFDSLLDAAQFRITPLDGALVGIIAG